MWKADPGKNCLIELQLLLQKSVQIEVHSTLRVQSSLILAAIFEKIIIEIMMT